jgi:hypothetical protein
MLHMQCMLRSLTMLGSSICLLLWCASMAAPAAPRMRAAHSESSGSSAEKRSSTWGRHWAKSWGAAQATSTTMPWAAGRGRGRGRGGGNGALDERGLPWVKGDAQLA